MSKSINKIKLTLIAVLFAVVYACIGTMLFAKANDTLTNVSEITSFQMDGAELIVEGNDGVNGINFTASISQSEYNALKSLDENFEIGVVIIPSYFDIAEIESKMFGSEAVYDWADFVNGEWVYSGDKIQIVNINANRWIDTGNRMTYSGAIVDILDHNEVVAFSSVAYIKVTDAGSVESFAWTRNVASTSVALEVEKTYSGMSSDQKAWVDANWTKFEIFEGTSELIDVAGLENISGLRLLFAPEDEEELYIRFGDIPLGSISVVDNFGNEMIFNPQDGEPTIAITDDILRQWTASVKLGGIELYTRTFDLYDSTAKPVWNELSDADGFKVYYGNDSTKEFIAVKTIEAESVTFDGKTSLEISNILGHSPVSPVPGEMFMTMLPIHSKEYYTRYEGKDVSFDYSFYYAIDPEFNGEGKYVVNQYSYYGAKGRTTGGQNGTDAFFNTWYNVNIPLDTVIEDWDNIVNLKDAQYAWGAGMTRGLIYALTSDFGSLGGFEGTGLKLYVAGFDVALDISKLAMQGGDILIDLDNVADKTALDLSSYMDADDYQTILDVAAVNGVSYELKGYSISDTIAVTDLTSVDVSSAKEAAYVLTVTSSGLPLYVATIDLYTESSPVVWAESMTSENVVLRKLAYSTGWVSSNAVLMEEGVDYEFVNTLTVGSKTYDKSYVKVTVNEACTIAFDLKALHSKSYYREMSDLTKVLHIRGYFPSKVSMDANFSANNYGMNNTYSTWRNSTSSNTYESIVISLDNFLIATDTNNASGKYYDWTGITGTTTGNKTMVQFEIPASEVASSAFEFYLGDTAIEEAGETVVSAAGKYVNTTIDLSGETTSFDLINVIPESQRAKLIAMAKAWGATKGKKSASCVGFNLTINGTVHSVKPDAQGQFLLNLDDYVVAADDTVSATTKVRDLLNEGNNSVSIIGYAPPVRTMGLSSWSVTMAASGTLTIIGPAPVIPEPEEGEYDINAVAGMESEYFVLVIDFDTFDLTSHISDEDLATLAEIKDAGYTLKYMILDDSDEYSEYDEETVTALDNDGNVWGGAVDPYEWYIVAVSESGVETTVLTGSFSVSWD